MITMHKGILSKRGFRVAITLVIAIWILYPMLRTRTYFPTLLIFDHEIRKELSEVELVYPQYGLCNGDTKSKTIISINALGKKLRHTKPIASGYLGIPNISSNKKIATIKFPEKTLLIMNDDSFNETNVSIYPYSCTSVPSWSNSSQFVATYEQRSSDYQDIINVYSTKENAKVKIIEIPEKPYRFTWNKNDDAIILYMQNENGGKGLFKLDIDSEQLTDICPSRLFKHHNSAVEDIYEEPGECNYLEDVQELFGHPQDPVNWLIARSPSGRFYFSYHSPDSILLTKEWIEAHDTVTGKSWLVRVTHRYIDTFFDE